MARQHSLEDLQEQYATYRRRAEPGLTYGDITTRMYNIVNRLDHNVPGPDVLGASLGELLIDLCCLAQIERLDLAHHARQAFRRMQEEYEASQ